MRKFRYISGDLDQMSKSEIIEYLTERFKKDLVECSILTLYPSYSTELTMHLKKELVLQDVIKYIELKNKYEIVLKQCKIDDPDFFQNALDSIKTSPL